MLGSGVQSREGREIESPDIRRPSRQTCVPVTWGRWSMFVPCPKLRIGMVTGGWMPCLGVGFVPVPDCCWVRHLILPRHERSALRPSILPPTACLSPISTKPTHPSIPTSTIIKPPS